MYFSNDRVTDSGCFLGLDHYLAYLISTLTNSKLQSKLGKYSYVSGFEDKTFHVFNARELTSIVKAWAYEA